MPVSLGYNKIPTLACFNVSVLSRVGLLGLKYLKSGVCVNLTFNVLNITCCHGVSFTYLGFFLFTMPFINSFNGSIIVEYRRINC